MAEKVTKDRLEELADLVISSAKSGLFKDEVKANDIKVAIEALKWAEDSELFANRGADLEDALKLIRSRQQETGKSISNDEDEVQSVAS